jgi:uncharacterized protein
MHMQALPPLGVGLAYQAPLAPLIEAGGAEIDFVEVVPDILWTDLGPGARPRHLDDEASIQTLTRLRGQRPLVAHSIGLSIGSAGGLDLAHLAQIHRWWQRWRFPWHSDHLAFHLAQHEGRTMNVGITLPLPRDRETLDLLVPRIHEVQRCVPVPFLLENNVYYFDIPNAEMDEARFLNTLCRESGCGLVLDLHNLYTNARNHGFDAWALLAEMELQHVGEIHIAGGMELDGFYLDAHSDTVPAPVWALLEWALPRCPNLGGVVFELFGSWFDSVGPARVRTQMHELQTLWQAVHGAKHRGRGSARRGCQHVIASA